MACDSFIEMPSGPKSLIRNELCGRVVAKKMIFLWKGYKVTRLRYAKAIKCWNGY